MSLVLVTLVWGSTFVVVKNAIVAIEPLSFVALRFVLASMLLLAVFARPILRSRWPVWRAGFFLGSFLLAGFILQTLGLLWTTPARAGFITGLCVVIVPMLQAILTRQRPSRPGALGIGLATVGMAVLSAPISPEEIGSGYWFGDLLVAGCAIAFAAHIVGVGHLGRGNHPGVSTSLQIAVAAIGATILAFTFGTGTASTPLDASAWVAIGYVGLVATAPTFLVQNWAQRHTTATHTALIFALEPVFAALFSAQFYGEILAPRIFVGGALILIGIICAEVLGVHPIGATQTSEIKTALT